MIPGFTAVVSSSLAGYLHRPDGTLLVAFRSGALYAYANVSPQLVAALAAAPSKGGYFNMHIKKAHDWRLLSEDEVRRLGQPVVRPRARAQRPSDRAGRALPVPATSLLIAASPSRGGLFQAGCPRGGLDKVLGPLGPAFACLRAAETGPRSALPGHPPPGAIARWGGAPPFLTGASTMKRLGQIVLALSICLYWLAEDGAVRDQIGLFLMALALGTALRASGRAREASRSGSPS